VHPRLKKHIITHDYGNTKLNPSEAESQHLLVFNLRPKIERKRTEIDLFRFSSDINISDTMAVTRDDVTGTGLRQ
jgi:hypothetical protein